MIGTVRTAIELLQRLVERPPAYDPANDDRRFRICMTDASYIALLPHLLTQLRERAPKVRLEALPISAATGSLLESGDADLALGRVRSLESGFYQQTLYSQDWVCLVGRRFVRSNYKLTVGNYAKAGHIGIVGGTGDDLLQDALTRLGFNRRVVLELPGFLGLPAIIAETDLIATLPRHISETLAKTSRLRILACPTEVDSFLVKQHWHARYHQDPGNKWLRGTCTKLFQKGGSYQA